MFTAGVGMIFRKMAQVAACCGLALASGGAHAQEATSAQADSLPVVTQNDAEKAFAKAILFDCMSALETGQPIADLPEVERSDLRPATPDERKMSRGRDKAVPVWASRTLGVNLTVTETSPQRCDVTAFQLRVDETFRRAMGAVALARPSFHDVPQKPGYNPIVYQMEGDYNGAHYIVHMEGAEPGGFGHAFRFSLLSAWVIRQDLK
jgi:hypothetical protein